MATFTAPKTGKATLNGSATDDVITGNDNGMIVNGGGSTAGGIAVEGDKYFVTKNVTINGGTGNDTFVINKALAGAVLHGGVSTLDNSGNTALYSDPQGDGTFEDASGNAVSLSTQANSSLAQTDVRLNVVTRPGSSSISTQATTIAGYNAVDTIEFKTSGDFTGLVFDGIERIELADGVSIKLAADAFEVNGNSQDRGYLNPGLQIFGTAGGKAETVTVMAEYTATQFNPTAANAPKTAYNFTDFQLDDYSIAQLFTNVKMVYDMRLVQDDDGPELDTTLAQYARVDGSNDSEFVYGTAGSDNATMRLGDDTYYAGAGNDLLVGHGGADLLDGGDGNDYFTITGFGSGNQGTSSKADDGQPEWIATGTKHDVINGGSGVDTLRITTGIGATNATTGKVLLNDANFKNMEVVEVGGLVGRINTEDSALQLINGHYYLNKTGTVSDTSAASGNNGGTINNVVIDASGVTTNGLRFEGNANTQTFIGTTKNDVFVGNGGNDTLTGGKGNDLFVFNKVQQQTVIASSDTTLPSSYAVVTSALTGVDTITDFTRGKDKIGLGLDMFTGYTKAGGIGADTIVVGAGAVALDANDYLIFDTTTKTLKFDADGSGAGVAVDIAILTGVTTLTTSDFTLV